MFRQTLEVNPSFAVAHWGLAQCYRTLGRTEDELDELTKAVTLSDNSSYMDAVSRSRGVTLQNRADRHAYARPIALSD